MLNLTSWPSSWHGDGLFSTIPIDQVYDLSTLDVIRAGNIVPVVLNTVRLLNSVLMTSFELLQGLPWDPAFKLFIATSRPIISVPLSVTT